MRVYTINFGTLDVPDDKIITFKQGLPGFPQIHRYAILDAEELKPFQYLQSLDDPPISLFVINPFLLDPGYEFRLSDSDMDEVGSSSSSELAVYVVATIPGDPQQATINLMAPIVINAKGRLGKQVILHESKYSVKHPLLARGFQSEAKS